MTSRDAIAPRRKSKQPPAPVEEAWFVAMSSGIRAMTLPELEQAFERGTIDANTQVWTSGMQAWETLALVADLEAPQPLDQSGTGRRRLDTVHGLRARPAPQPLSYPPPLPALAHLNEGLLASVIPPPPASVRTLVRRRVRALSSGAALEQWARDGVSWFRAQGTWERALLTAALGMGLLIVLYRGTATDSGSADASAEAQTSAAAQTRQGALLPSTALGLPPADVAAASVAPVAPAAALAAPVAAALPVALAAPTLESATQTGGGEPSLAVSDATASKKAKAKARRASAKKKQQRKAAAARRAAKARREMPPAPYSRTALK